MGKIFEVIIDRFDGGLTEDKRSKSFNKFSITKHFDTLTYPHKLVPYFGSEAVETKSMGIRAFQYAQRDSSPAFKLFGHGASSGKNAVYMLTPTDTAWATPTNNTSTLSRVLGCFFHYKDFIYMWGGTEKLTRFDVTSAAVFNDAYQTISPSFTTVAQPVHHPTDDVAYFFTDNNVHKLNNTDWTEDALVLPSNLTIICACPYGNYLAIGCVTKGTHEIKSIVFLWDRDSTITTLSDRVDLGSGSILHLATLDNKLIAVINYFASAATGLNRGRLLIKQVAGQTGILLNQLIFDTDVVAANFLPTSNFVKNNKLYFPASVYLNGDDRFGIWVVDSKGQATLDFIVSEATSIHGIYSTGEMWWVAHSGDGSVNRTEDNGVYAETSIYESLIFNGDDSGKTKKLIGVEVMHEPLPTAGQVVLKYRKDSNLDSTWTTILTNTTDDSISKGAIRDSSGDLLPEYKEIQFRIESTGGAVITGLRFKYEIVDKQLF